MSQFLVFLFFAAIVISIRRATRPGLRRTRPQRSARIRRRPPPAPVESRRPSSLPPPTAAAPPPEPVELVEPDPLPPPTEPVVVEAAAPRRDPEPEPEDAPESFDPSAAAPDLGRQTTIVALFGDLDERHTRLNIFDADYEGRTIEWSAEVVRARTSRRNGNAATRAELFVGFASERRYPTDRVIVEAYFASGTSLEPDTPIMFAGTLTGLNVYARRLVVDDARIV